MSLKTIVELNEAMAIVTDDEMKRRAGSTLAKIKADKEKVREHAKEHSAAMLSIFKGKKGGFLRDHNCIECSPCTRIGR